MSFVPTTAEQPSQPHPPSPAQARWGGAPGVVAQELGEQSHSGASWEGAVGGGACHQTALKVPDAVLAKNKPMSVSQEPTQSSCICQREGGAGSWCRLAPTLSFLCKVFPHSSPPTPSLPGNTWRRVCLLPFPTELDTQSITHSIRNHFPVRERSTTRSFAVLKGLALRSSQCLLLESPLRTPAPSLCWPWDVFSAFHVLPATRPLGTPECFYIFMISLYNM